MSGKTNFGPRGARGHADGYVDARLAYLAHLGAVDEARSRPRPTTRISCRRCGNVPRVHHVQTGGYHQLDDGTWTCRRYPKCEPIEGGEEYT